MRNFTIPYAQHCANPVADRAARGPTRSVMEVKMQRMVSVIAGSAVLLLAGCSFGLFDGKKVDYRTTGSTPTLEVPPDLTMPAFDDRFRDRPGSATASGLAAGAQPARSGVLPVVDTGRVERAGSQRWLVVQGSPEA